MEPPDVFVRRPARAIRKLNAMSVAVGIAHPRRSSGTSTAATSPRYIAAGASIPPIAAMTGIAAFEGGCSTPCGAVASTISFAASAKNRVIPISLTTKRPCAAKRE
jgi:hypothetical protein